MAENGQLVQWNDERGFGFIEAGNGQRHFVHVSSIGRIATRPRIGDSVTFEPHRGSDGRLQARSVRILGANPAPSFATRARGEPAKATNLDWRLPFVLGLLAILAAGFALGRIPLALILGYFGMGLVSLIAYRMDKHFATTGQWRISEATLLGLDLCLGVMGGLLGQALFRHKTRKPGYVAATVLILAAHLAGLAAFAGGFFDPDSLVTSMLSWLAPGG